MILTTDFVRYCIFSRLDYI